MKFEIADSARKYQRKILFYRLILFLYFVFILGPNLNSPFTRAARETRIEAVILVFNLFFQKRHPLFSYLQKIRGKRF